VTEAKASTKNAAAPKKAAAARAEKTGEGATFEFRGLELQLPSKLPLSIAFQWRKVMKDKNGDQFAILGVLENLIGPEQYEAVEQKIDAEKLTIDDDADVLVELIDGVMEALGTTSGE
jgi:hypothetical protein